ncbi:uncharacterized protein PV07_09685 [Cladophialophora immunda]|uniref:Xylanolytic transcriptional activator regulatory domain-containing protein n=1 Tax=Cladophialophora immunda TaxID=569365 RepID=A0A0D2BXW6_9EURO|nr:uncharacterized protein PV07_09685 [Cladophialophora immunda]KIW23938.1 hypothetical protein PV07_09685 [Cladophialophora immunda]
MGNACTYGDADPHDSVLVQRQRCEGSAQQASPQTQPSFGHESDRGPREVRGITGTVTEGLLRVSSVLDVQVDCQPECQPYRSTPSPCHVQRPIALRRSRVCCEKIVQDPAGGHHSVFNLAGSMLHREGILTSPSTIPEPGCNSCSKVDAARFTEADWLAAAEPVIELGHFETNELIGFFEDYILPIYPCVEMSTVKNIVETIFHLAELGCVSSAQPLPYILSEKRIKLLKILLEVALLFKGVREGSIPKGLEGPKVDMMEGNVAEDPEIDDVVFLTLTTIYLIHREQIVRAWRLISRVTRMCLELGLHETRHIGRRGGGRDNPDFRQILFCCVNVLDRQVSVATGLPVSIPEDQPDPDCLELGAAQPFLSAMVEYYRICFAASRIMGGKPSNEGSRRNESQHLDSRVREVRDDFTLLLQQRTKTAPLERRTTERPLAILQTMLHARVNHLRMALRKEQISSAQNARDHRDTADIALKLAKDTISACCGIRNRGCFPRGFHSFFVYFVMSAVAVITSIFPALSPSDQDLYHVSLQDAIRFIDNSSRSSPNSQYSWFDLKTLKEYCHVLKQQRSETINLNFDPQFSELDMDSFSLMDFGDRWWDEGSSLIETTAPPDPTHDLGLLGCALMVDANQRHSPGEGSTQN